MNGVVGNPGTTTPIEPNITAMMPSVISKYRMSYSICCLVVGPIMQTNERKITYFI